MKTLQTKTGDWMQVSECNENEITYGIISIRLKEPFENLATAQKVVLEFMQQLQPLFSIQHATGVLVDHDLQQQKTAATDYWQDSSGMDWKIKGWTNRKMIVVGYIKNINCMPIAKEELFLNGVLFTND